MTDYFGYTKWQLAGVAWVVIVVFLFWGYILPKWNHTMDIYNNVQQQQVKIASAQNWEVNLAKLNRKYHNLEDHFSKIFVNIPKNDQMSTVIEELYKQSEAASVKLERMRPQDRLEHPAYDELPINVTVKGGYHQLGRFMNGIEYSKYLIKIENVSIQATETPKMPLSAQILVKVVILEGDTDLGEVSDA